MSEVLALRARLALTQELLATTELEIGFFLRALRQVADPYADKNSIDTKEMAVLVANIDKNVTKIRELAKTIASIKKDLGE